MTAPLAIEVRGLQKSYNVVPVLRDFDFELRAGEVHALIGSNGAGKSTFAKVLTGLTPRNAGEVLLRGKPYSPTTKQEASASGIAMVLQELNVIPTLTVAENLFLNRLPNRGGVINHGTLHDQARTALARVGLSSIEPDMPAGKLGVGQQQLIEIAAALTLDATVLILDEPTAALTGPEIELLFENVNRLRENDVAIIYVSHRMDEIARIADRVTVLRDGRTIATHEVADVEVSQLVREMAGDEVAERTGATQRDLDAPMGLSVSDLHCGEAVNGVSFEVAQGEILGIAGLIGSGRTETLRAIFGADRASSGSVKLGSGGAEFLARTPQDAVQRGIGLIPEDRKHDGLLLPKSIIENVTLPSPAGDRSGTTATICAPLEVKYDSLDQAVSELSGGNQQKIVIARWLLRDCEVLLFDEPTRGVDVAAKEAIYRLLDDLAAKGKTIVVVSSDLLELMQISHRIVAMSAGKITGEFLPGTEHWSQEAITAAAFSGYLKDVA